MSEDTHPKSDQFNAFTPQARAVVVWACEEARTLGHGQVVAGHVVLGLLREPFTFAAALLTAAGMELEQVRGRLRPLVASRPKDSATPIAFSESAVQIFSAARKLAELHHPGRVGSEHVLLALLASTDASAQRALADRVDLDIVERSVADIREQAELPSVCDTSAFAIALRNHARGQIEERVNPLLARAEEEAVDDGRSALRSGDLLLALQAGLPDPEAARALTALRIERAELETALAKLRSASPA